MQSNLTINIKKTLFILFVLNIFFFFFLSASYLIPNRFIRKNIKNSVNTISSEGLYYNPLFKLSNNLTVGYQLDNFTDSLIMNILYNSQYKNVKNVFKKAVLNSKYQPDLNMIQNLDKLTSENINANDTYERYWFGELILLRPLFALVNYKVIRILNIIITLIIVSICLRYIMKSLGLMYAIAFSISLLFMGAIIIPISLQYFPVFILTMLSSIGIMVLHNKKNYYDIVLSFFIIVGSLTAFFDLLTYPLLTLGIPLLLFISLEEKNNKINKKHLIDFIKICVFWSIGYFGSYFFKWMLASILLNENAIRIAIDQFFLRTGSTDFTRVDATLRNIKVYFNKYNLIIITIMFSALLLFSKTSKNKSINKTTLLIYILLLLMPYIWFFCFSNHSYVHYWMTYRIQMISFLSVFNIFCLFIKKNSCNKKNCSIVLSLKNM